MQHELNPDTVEELIDTLLKIGSRKMSIAFRQSTITEINGIHSVAFLCVLRESLPSQFGDISVDPLPLTGEEEFIVNPSFEFTTAHPDAIYDDNSVYEATQYDGTPQANLDLLKKVCSEVNLTEEQLIHFAQHRNTQNQVVQHIEVRSSNANESRYEEFVEDLAHNKPATSQPEEIGLQFLITLQAPKDHYVDGLHVSNRFDHVDSVAINGHRYPATIKTLSFADWETSLGQWIHTSNFLANNTAAPEINLSDELDRIAWDEFFASERMLPEPEKSQSNHQL